LRGELSMVKTPIRILVTGLILLLTTSISVANQPYETATNRGIIPVSHFDVSPPLKFIAPAAPLAKMQKGGLMIDPNGFEKETYGVQDVDSIVQETKSVNTISPVASFDGIPNVAGFSPPDPVGAVGLNHYVVMTNVHFQIFNKDGTTAMAAAANNTLWTGFGGACENQNAGDPIALYDQINDRWLLSQFTSSAVGGEFFNCVALSTTGDPTGTYYRWAFSTGGNFPDYPKYGIWSNAYLISTREFTGSSYSGVGAYAINKDDMLNGVAAPRMLSFFADRTNPYTVGDGLLPADIDGDTMPSAGAPAYFVGTQDNGGPYSAPSDALNLWKFVIDFDTPANSSFTLTDVLPITPFDTIFTCPGGGRNCLPQPGTSNMIDIQSYRQRPLHRLAYRNFGTHESLVTNQSVEAQTGVAGIRWWEIRSPNSSPLVYQEGTYAPGVTDGTDRWMASAAMDGEGNIALGYSATSSTVFPSLWYTGRLASDPLGQMTQGEGSIVDGGGSQTGSQRWGDYTSLNIDPVDDCTFWYVNEYYVTSSSAGWQTRIGAFKFDECGTPGFYLSTIPSKQSICTADDAAFQVNVGSIALFNSPVSLTTTGQPLGSTANFSSNPVMTLPGTTSLTISNTAAISAGIYPIDINGTATGAANKTKTITLTVFDTIADQPTLTLPTDNAVNQVFRPDFTWAGNNSESYLFELATDSAFTQIVESKTTTANATSISSDLNSNSTYYWRVTATNACGDSVVSAAFAFTTQPAPGDCAAGFDTINSYSIDFENGSGGWSSQGAGNTWQLSTARPHNGSSSFHALDPVTASDQELISPQITLPAGNSTLTLQFWNYQEMESRNATQCWDGGTLEISTDNGTSWSPIPTSKMLTDSYTGSVSGLGDVDGWCGDPQDYLNSVVDIDNFAGQTVRFRFRLGSDASVGREGWYIDDVKVQSCATAVPEITVSKTAVLTTDNGFPGEADVNDVITYSVSIENTGGVMLDTLVVTDSMVVGALTCTPTALPPNGTATCTDYTYTILQSDIDAGGTINNTASATMTDPTDLSTYNGSASTQTTINFAFFKDGFE